VHALYSVRHPRPSPDQPLLLYSSTSTSYIIPLSTNITHPSGTYSASAALRQSSGNSGGGGGSVGGSTFSSANLDTARISIDIQLSPLARPAFTHSRASDQDEDKDKEKEKALPGLPLGGNGSTGSVEGRDEGVQVCVHCVFVCMCVCVYVCICVHCAVWQV